MDPEVTWRELLAARLNRNWPQAQQLAHDLRDWLDRGGFPPVTMGDIQLGVEWHAGWARRTCNFVLDEVHSAAQRRQRRAQS